MDRNWMIGITAVISVAVISLLAPILWPFLMGALFAYLLDPWVEWLSKKFHRTWVVSGVFVLFIGSVACLLVALVPLFVRQMHYLVRLLPDAIHWLQNQAGLPLEFPMEFVEKHGQSVGGIVAWLVKALSYSSVALIHTCVTGLLTLIILFYLLRDWNGLLKGFQALLPTKAKPTILLLIKQCNDVLSAFFRGQLLVMCLLGLFYTVALSLLGLHLSSLIGGLAGLLSIVPYLGFIVGLGAALLASYFQFHAWFPIGMAALIFLIGHGLESFLLVPWFIGDKVGLHPVAVIFAMLVGGQLFGFFGLLLALPVAAVVMVLLRYFYTTYFYKARGS